MKPGMWMEPVDGVHFNVASSDLASGTKSKETKDGVRTVHSQTEEEESVGAELIYRGSKLVALHTNW